MSTPVVCDLLIIGGGPAGMAAIRGFRKHHGRGDVVLVSAEDTLPYARPALSKEFLRGDTDAGDLMLGSPEFYVDIDLRLGVPIASLDTEKHLATTGDDMTIRYSRCVIATGGTAKPLPVPGGDDPRLHCLRSLADAHRLRAAALNAGSALVLGSGFIGCEAAVSLARRGLDVTVISPEPHPQQDRLGEAAGQRLAGWLTEEGIRLRLGVTIEEILDGRRVRLAGDRDPVSADLVLAAGGVAPQISLATAAGLRCVNGRILVDDHMRSSAADVYAVGDAALAVNHAAGRRVPVEHWGEALRMGEIAGANAGGGDECWDRVPGFWTQIGDRIIKYVAWGDGFTEARLVEHGTDGFTIWYGTGGVLVGALTYRADDDYDRAHRLIREAATMASVTGSPR